MLLILKKKLKIKKLRKIYISVETVKNIVKIVRNLKEGEFQKNRLESYVDEVLGVEKSRKEPDIFDKFSKGVRDTIKGKKQSKLQLKKYVSLSLDHLNSVLSDRDIILDKFNKDKLIKVSSKLRKEMKINKIKLERFVKYFEEY